MTNVHFKSPVNQMMTIFDCHKNWLKNPTTGGGAVLLNRIRHSTFSSDSKQFRLSISISKYQEPKTFSNMGDLVIKWNNYESGLTRIFENMLDSESLCDVTIACDGQSLKAHKLILSACSPYFESLFMNNPCKHPIVILKDVLFTDLRSLVDFMYRGAVTVSRDQLPSLLKTGETLQITQLAEMVKKPSYEAAVAQAATTSRKRRRRSRRTQHLSAAADGLASESEGDAGSGPSPSRAVQEQVIYHYQETNNDVENDGQMVQEQSNRILEVSMEVAELVGGGDGDVVSGDVHEDGIGEQIEGEEEKGEELDSRQLNILSALFATDSDNSIMLSKKKMSFVWEYFHETGKGSVKCKKCNKLLSYKDSSGSTSNMIKHLKTVHTIERAPRPPLLE